MKTRLTPFRKLAALLFIGFSSSGVFALQLPIRELVKVSSLRANQLIGYGLVVGLPQTGDSRSVLAQDALRKLLRYKGIKISEKDLKSKNIAAVMVTGRVPAFAQSGSEIDIWVSSIGDAKSLKNGYLLQTPLLAADGKIYAVAQASITSPAKNAVRLGLNNNRRRQQKTNQADNKQTTVRIPAGAIMEKTVIQPLSFTDQKNQNRYIKLRLIHFNLTTAQNIIKAINEKFSNTARLEPGGEINLKFASGTSAAEFLSQIYDIVVEVKQKAKVVIDTRSATIVMGENVGISAVAVSKNGISIRIDQKSTNTIRKSAGAAFLPETPNVAQLVATLNDLGLNAEDIIDILKTIHAAGALHAELIIL